jgi:recombination protein RecT
MATNASLKNQLQNSTSKTPSPIAAIKSILDSPSIKKRFEEILDKRAPQFMSSIVNLYASDGYLQKCEPMSVISSAMVAATLDLPIDKNLGYAWVVPYKDKSGRQIAQFQLGYKGYIQLALRTAKYKAINVLEVHQGELQKWNPLTEELIIDFEKKKSDSIIGYAGYFELINGFRKTVYWTKEQIEAHRKKFSKSDFGWKNDYDAMAKKTVIRNMLSKWGILSIEMQQAYNEESEPQENVASETNPVVIDTDFQVIDDEPGPDSETNEPSEESQVDHQASAEFDPAEIDSLFGSR